MYTGNHERNGASNFKEYRYRFPMPSLNSKGELHYSFDYGPFHFVSLNTEVYYHRKHNLSNVTSMYRWLIRDLADVKRHITPWVIIFGHRPMYCAKVTFKINRVCFAKVNFCPGSGFVLNQSLSDIFIYFVTYVYSK